MSDEPKGYEQALGAVPWTPDTEPSEVVIRRMRDGVEVGERFETRQRGDTYRRRALALMARCRHLRHWDDLTPEEEAEIAKDIAEYEATKDDPYRLVGVYWKQVIEWQAQAADIAAAHEHAASLSAERDAARAEADGLAMLLARAMAFINYRSNLYNEIDAALAARAQSAHVSESGERNVE